MRDYDRHLKKTYGITLKQFDAMCESREYRCDICQRDDLLLIPDHCHTSGRIRGVLCKKCNMGLGLLGDTVARLQTAFQYIQGEATIPHEP